MENQKPIMENQKPDFDSLLEELLRLRKRVQELEGSGAAASPRLELGAACLNGEALIEALPSAVGIVYADGKIVTANRRWREILDSQPASVTVDEQARLMKVLHPDRTPIPDEELPRYLAMQTGEVVRNQEAILYKTDGDEIPVLISAAPIRDGQDEVIAAVVVFDDITEFKQLQERLAKGLRDSRRQAFLLKLIEALRPIADSTRILERTTQMLGDHFHADHVSYCQMEETGSFYTIIHDYHREGLTPNSGRHDLESSHPRFAAGLRAGKTIIARDVFVECELTERQKTLYTVQKLMAFVSVPLVKDDRLTAFLRVQFERPHDWQLGDISLIEEVAERTWAAVERAHAESVTQQTLARLEYRTRELDAVIASIPDGLTIYDSNINPIYLNEGARLFFERYQIEHRDDFSARAEYGKIMTEDGRILKKEEWAIYRACVNGETIRDFIQMAPGKEGQPYYTSVSCAPIRDEHGKITGAVSMLKDITHQKQAEIKLRDSEQRSRELVEDLKIADQNKSHFISVLSHELRNPLAAIVLSQSLLKQVPAESGPGQRAWAAIERQTGILVRLVDDLLDVTRISENKIKLRPEVLDLGAVIGRTVSDFEEAFEKKGVGLHQALPEQPLLMNADPVRITQAIGNLLHNALKFTRDGDRVTVSMQMDEAAGEAVIQVGDTGMGIEPEIVRCMFDPFAQADRSLARTQGGLGLGLSIVKGMVELHGGRIEAASEGIGKGATFTIRLPMRGEPVQA